MLRAPSFQTGLRLQCIAFTSRMTTFAYQLCCSLGRLATSAAKTLTFFQGAATGRVGTFLCVSHKASSYCNGVRTCNGMHKIDQCGRMLMEMHVQRQSPSVHPVPLGWHQGKGRPHQPLEILSVLYLHPHGPFSKKSAVRRARPNNGTVRPCASSPQ